MQTFVLGNLNASTLSVLPRLQARWRGLPEKVKATHDAQTPRIEILFRVANLSALTSYIALSGNGRLFRRKHSRTRKSFSHHPNCLFSLIPTFLWCLLAKGMITSSFVSR